MHLRKGCLTNFAWILSQILDDTTSRVLRVSLHLTRMGWEPGADSSVHEGLDASCRGGPFVGQKNLAQIPHENQIGVNLFKDPC
jgi:hypothetical protein